MTERPYILVSNDDGIEADGLWLLAEALLEVGDVIVAAPAFQQSGSGTAFTLHRELQSERAHSRVEGIEAWQIDGTPTDAVVVGLRQHAARHVEMVVSGVNAGPNMGRDVLHSGTVGAALQGYQRRLPSIASSIVSAQPENLPAAAAVTARLAAALHAAAEPLFLNLNVPDQPEEDLGSARVTHVADLAPERLIEETEPDGMIHRRLELRDDIRLPLDSDVWAVHHGFVSVSPLRLNLTAFDQFAATERLLSS